MSMQRPSKAFAALAIGFGLSSPMITIPESTFAATQAAAVKSTPSKPGQVKKDAEALKNAAIDKEIEKLGVTKGSEQSQRLGEELAVEGAVANQLVAKERLDELTSEIASYRADEAKAKAEITRLVNKAMAVESKLKNKNEDKDVKRLLFEEASVYRKDAATVRGFRNDIS